MTVPYGKSEVVRYTAREPKGWIKRGDLLRVIGRTNGKVRVTRAYDKAGGAPQYVLEQDVERVGTFANATIFGGDLEQIANVEPLPEADDPTLDAEDEAKHESMIGTVGEFRVASPAFAVLPPCEAVERAERECGVEDGGPAVDLRDLVRAEVRRQVADVLAEIVREEVSRCLR